MNLNLLVTIFHGCLGLTSHGERKGKRKAILAKLPFYEKVK